MSASKEGSKPQGADGLWSEQNAASALFKESADAIIIADLHGRILHASPACEAIYGWSCAELIGQELPMVPAEAGPESKALLATLAQGKAIRAYETVRRRREGSFVDVSVTLFPIRNPEGTVVAVASISRDISERKRLARALEESEARYRDLFESAYDVVFIADGDGKILEINQRGVEVTGYAKAELAGMNVVRDLCVPEDQTLIRSVLEDVVAGRERIYEVGWRARTGAVLRFEGATTSRRSPSGEFLSTRCTLRDITDRKHAENALRQTTGRLAALVQASPLAIIGIDSENRVTMWNLAAEQLFGWTALEVSGRLLPTVPEHHRDEFRAWQARLLRGKTITALDTQRLRKDGTVVDVAVSLASLRGEGDQSAGLLEISADRTEQRRLEEKLRQAQKMEAIGRLAAGVAHDFNNVLTVILGHCSLLLPSLRNDVEQARHVRQVNEAAQRAASLTKQLLAFSRQQLVQPQMLDLSAVVVDLLPMLRRLIGEDLEVVTRLGQELGVVADCGQLEQVILNLAINARDAMPHGGRLIIETDYVELNEDYENIPDAAPAGSYVRLVMSDTGVGMDKATMGKIFEPFFTTKELGKGTGLGLATVYGIVRQSGGSVRVYSEPGQGTTFKIHLPRAQGPTETLKGPAVEMAPPRGSETILLVEDEEAVRALAQEVLGMNGYHVLVASGAEEAVEVCERWTAPIHLLCTDVVLPRMSGRALAERLKALRPDMRVMYMSGYTDEALGHHGIPDPGLVLLQKPFSPGGLARKVREVLAATG